jgi:hypothetical protein
MIRLVFDFLALPVTAVQVPPLFHTRSANVDCHNPNTHDTFFSSYDW